MLDPTCLPKNANGFRTTHTCELCGFEPKTKNKYREKQDHLVMKHFKDRIDKIFPHCRPYTCPNPECDFTGKDKQALLRHYTGKHGVLELYLREALAEKGIQYQLSDSAKRKSMGHSDLQSRKPKEPRLSPPQITSIHIPPVTTQISSMSSITTIPTITSIPTITTLPQPQVHETMVADTTTHPEVDFPIRSDIVYTSTVTRLPTAPTTKLPSMSTVLTRPFTNNGKCDVDALLASFQPIDNQLVLNLPPSDLPLDSPLVSSTTPDFFILPEESSKVILNDNIMWGGGNLAISSESTQNSTASGYLDSTDSGLIDLGDIDYDYLCPATIEPTAPAPILASSNQERQLAFSML